MFIQLLTPRSGAPLELTRLNVIFGPNQSGKSALLRDIYQLAAGRLPHSEAGESRKIDTPLLEDMQFGGASEDSQLSQGPVSPLESDTTVFHGLGGDLRGVVRAMVHHDSWNIIKRPTMHARSVLGSELPDVMMLRLVYLDEQNLDIAAAAAPSASPLEPPRNLLQLLQVADAETHAELDAAFAAAFPPQGLRLDESEGVRLTLRVGDDFPEPQEDRVANAKSWQALPALDDAGRGARNLAAVAMSVLLMHNRIIIVDEPDASLEPFAARQLGRWLATAAKENDCQLIVSARTTALPAGMQERSDEVTLLHTPAQSAEHRIGAVPPQRLKAVASSPLISLSNALEAMRRNGVVLVEHPLEAAAIDALNAHRGGSDRWSVVCIHDMAQAATLLHLMRDAGVPAAVIGRVAHLEDRDMFRDLIKAACRGPMPGDWLATRDQLARHVARVQAGESATHTDAMERALEKIGSGEAAGEELPELRKDSPWSRVEREGLAAIPIDQRSWVEQLLEEMKAVGVFITAHGSSDEVPPEVFQELMRSIYGGQTPDRLAVTLTEVVQYLRSHSARAH